MSYGSIMGKDGGVNLSTVSAIEHQSDTSSLFLKGEGNGFTYNISIPKEIASNLSQYTMTIYVSIQYTDNNNIKHSGMMMVNTPSEGDTVYINMGNSVQWSATFDIIDTISDIRIDNLTDSNVQATPSKPVILDITIIGTPISA